MFICSLFSSLIITIFVKRVQFRKIGIQYDFYLDYHIKSAIKSSPFVLELKLSSVKKTTVQVQIHMRQS